MNNLQILTQAIQKAQKNGYRYILEYDDENDKYYARMLDLNKYYAIIFSHDFAKAFWGERAVEKEIMSYNEYMNNEHGKSNWEYHIQRMSLCKEPLEYIKYYLGE